MKPDFNPKIFSQNIHDYLLKKAVDTRKRFFLANFTPLNFMCVIRMVTEVNDRSMYENECYINRKLHHPNLLKIYQTFIVADTLVSVLPYCEKGNVGDLVQPTFGVKESFTVMVLVDILKAVDYLHRNLIIHRAIKGNHILIVSSGNGTFQFLLTGLKYAIDMSDKIDLQTHEYPPNANRNLQSMAPEIFEQNTIGYNYKADIYSIGLLCCEMSNGITCFHNAPTDELLLCKILAEQPPLIDQTIVPGDWKAFKDTLQDKNLKITEKLKERYEHYSKRKYTDEFRDFVSVGCLHIEPAKRLTAAQLLKHSFITTNNGKLLRLDFL